VQQYLSHLIQIKLKKYFFLFIGIINSLSASINTHGQVGYISSPSAYGFDEAMFYVGLSRDVPDRKLAISASPFSWFDASLFYADITNKEYGNGFMQSYKDKGFSIKFNTPETIFNHKWAIGLNDIAGTGYYSSEYIVASNRINNFEYTFGIEWKETNRGIKLNNPLIGIDESFRNRSGSDSNTGGDFSFGNYFSGEDVSLIFAGSYALSRNLSILFELDNQSSDLYKIPEIRQPFNVALQKRYKNNTFFKTSIIRGNELHFQAGYLFDFNKFKSSQPLSVKEDISSINDLRKTLLANKISLRAVSSSKKNLYIDVAQNTFADQKIVYKNVFQNLQTSDIASDKEALIISQYYLGMKVNEKSFRISEPYNPNKIGEIKNEQKENKYVFTTKYPIIFNSFGPKLRSFFGSREAFYHGAILLELDNEIVFHENLVLLSNFKYPLISNFENLYIPPVNTYPNQVRSDIKDYLKTIGKKFSLGRFELNYFTSLNKSHFFRISAGIFEEMFGGYGLEYLNYNEGSIFSWGLEFFQVKKRDYDLKLDFKKYGNSLFRINTQIIEPKTNIKFKLSFGEYLAGDNGYTFDISRKFKNGVEYGIFWSQTDVSKSQYGEGSFDKGVRVKIPFSLFNQSALSTYEYHPLTKDPAALLIKSIDLQDAIERYRNL
tara:strand:+ start:25106 stop:27091 length:1986 start_codon:yes stop_codon:yes gene_type:complete